MSNNKRALGSKINPTDAIAQSVEGPISYNSQRPQYDPFQQGAPVSAPVTAPEPESYIVQNIFPGHQFISDIRLSFKPHEIVDLTWEDPRYIKRSTDLSRSLRAGFLRKLTQEEFQRSLDNEALAKRQATAQAMQQQSNPQQQQVDAGGRSFNADVIDMDGHVKGHHGEDITTAGNWNDPITYAIEENRIRAASTARGQSFDSVEFGKWVQGEIKAGRRGPVESNRIRNNDQMGVPALPGSNMSGMFPNGTTSGTNEPGRYTVATAPGGWGDTNNIQQGVMSNYNRDQWLAGSSAAGISSFQNKAPEQPGLAEHIDLNTDDAYGYDGEDSGGIKKMF